MAEMQRTLVTREGLEKCRRNWMNSVPQNVRKSHSV